ncbi:MAG: hypothetical protein L3J20_01890 [Flavobacteriaceae bacterium]|nr:hypothetical protein [Flavobacteriaceae bacterium]
MRKLVVAVIALFMFQFVLVSCEAEDQEFNKNVEQVKNETKSVVPGNAGGGDDDDEEDGS